MIRGCLAFIERLTSLFYNIIELRPKLKAVCLGFVQLPFMSNRFDGFCKIIWLLNNLEHRRRS